MAATAYTYASTGVTVYDIDTNNDKEFGIAIARAGKIKDGDAFGPPRRSGNSAIIIGFNTTIGTNITMTRAAHSAIINKQGDTAGDLTNAGAQVVALLYTYRKV